MAKHRLAQLKAEARAAGWLDQVRTPNDERALLAGCTFDVRLPERVREYFRRYIRHGDTVLGAKAGDVFELLEWQVREIVYPIYGWVWGPNSLGQVEGTRRIRKAYVSCAKKNGKSTLSGGLGLYHLTADGFYDRGRFRLEVNPEVYTAAADRTQAAIIFRQARKFVTLSPHLRAKLEVTPSTKTITVRDGHAFLQALSRESKTKEGINWSFLLFDELHAQPDAKLWDTLIFGGDGRIQPLLLIITTAGNDQTGICYQQYRYAKQVRDGEVEDLTVHCSIHEAEPDCPLDDPTAHAAANPSLGICVSPAAIMAQAKAAIAGNEEAKFRRYKLNQWVNVVGSWLPLDHWDACGKEAMDWDSLLGAECVGGLDLSSKLDMTAWVLVFPRADGTYVIKPTFWVPEDRATELSKAGNESYRNWAKSGYLELTPGGMVDYAFIEQRILEDHARYQLISVPYDPHEAGYLISRVTAEGVPCVELPQNVRNLSEPAKAFEAAVRTEIVRHAGHPVLRWHATNVSVRYDANDNIFPQKPVKGGDERIDGIAATINAFAEIERLKITPAGMTSGEFIEKYDGIMEL